MHWPDEEELTRRTAEDMAGFASDLDARGRTRRTQDNVDKDEVLMRVAQESKPISRARRLLLARMRRRDRWIAVALQAGASEREVAKVAHVSAIRVHQIKIEQNGESNGTE